MYIKFEYFWHPYRNSIKFEDVTLQSPEHLKFNCLLFGSVWNSLPSTVKQATSIVNFKKLLKTHLYPN
jgi:hypothetical protein